MVKNFTDSAEKELLSLVKQVESEQISNFTDWVGDGWYAFQEKIGTLDISKYLDNVNAYHKKVIDKNNASSDQIRAIFENVRNLDSNYATRFAAYSAMIAEFKGLIDQFSDVMSPQNGTFNPQKLSELLANYEKTEWYLRLISTEGLSEADIDEMDELTMASVLGGITSMVLNFLPTEKIIDGVEIPIGLGVSIYCSVSPTKNGNNNFAISQCVEDQKLKFKSIAYSRSIDGSLFMSVKVDTEEGIIESFGNNNWEIGFSEGKVAGAIRVETENDTYKFQISAAAEEVVFEESIATEMEGYSITTALGVKKTTNNGWKSIGVSSYVEEETNEIPTPNVNWGKIALGAAGSVAIGITIYEVAKWGIAAATAIPTGGISVAVAACLP